MASCAGIGGIVLAPQFRKVAIHGVGLLGGSLGMALRRRGMAERIVGLGRSRKRLERAIQLGAIDAATTDAAEALDGADALIECLPPRTILRKWAELAPLVAEGAFATDVGSVKAALVAEGEKRLGHALFVGSHPMAGSEESGVEAARSDLFEGRACFLAVSPATRPAALRLAHDFWKAVGARPVVVEPARHDRLMAALSHLPHLTASALVEALYRRGDATLLYRALAGGGLRDCTRVAEGPPDVWEQILLENSAELGDALDGLIAILGEWREALRRGDGGAIADRLDKAAARRRLLFAKEE